MTQTLILSLLHSPLASAKGKKEQKNKSFKVAVGNKTNEAKGGDTTLPNSADHPLDSW